MLMINPVLINCCTDLFFLIKSPHKHGSSHSIIQPVCGTAVRLFTQFLFCSGATFFFSFFFITKCKWFAACSAAACPDRFPRGAVPISPHSILTFCSGHLGTKEASGARSSCHRENVYRLMTLLQRRANDCHYDGRPIDWRQVSHFETVCGKSVMSPHVNSCRGRGYCRPQN